MWNRLFPNGFLQAAQTKQLVCHVCLRACITSCKTNKQTKISSIIASPATSSWRTNTRQRCSKFFLSVSASSPPQKKELWQKLGSFWKERGNRTASFLEQCICQSETTWFSQQFVSTCPVPVAGGILHKDSDYFLLCFDTTGMNSSMQEYDLLNKFQRVTF